MKEFLLILLFSKTVYLSDVNEPIVILPDGFEITLQEPVSAITSGAYIGIDVRELVGIDDKDDLLSSRRKIAEFFEGSNISSTLSNGSQSIRFTFKGNSAIGKQQASILLTSDDVPTGMDFHTLEITTSVKLENVRVYWVNHTK